MRSCIINFHAIFNTNLGQEIYIVGNHPELGQWDQNKGLKLITDKLSYPKWKSVRRIRINQSYLLQFKICKFSNNQFECWQNFPINMNRIFKTDCRSVTILIIQNNQSLIQEKRFNNFSSTELSSLHVRKYTSIAEQQLQSEESSSSSGYNDYYQRQNVSQIKQKYQHDIKTFVNTFRLLSDGWLKSKNDSKNIYYQNKWENSEFVKTQVRDLYYIINNINKQSHLYSQSNVFTVKINTQKYQKLESDTIKLCVQIHKHKKQDIQFLSSSLLCVGLQFCLFPKMLKRVFGDLKNMKLGLCIQQMTMLISRVHHNNEQFSLIMESLLIYDFMIFRCEFDLNEFVFFLEKQNLQISIKYMNEGEYMLGINEKLLFIRIQNDFIFKNQIKLPPLNIKSNVQKFDIIAKQYQKCKNKKIMIFSFGKYQNFQILLKNKQLISKLSNQLLIYVFTPNKLKFFADPIQFFQKIVFISYTYLQISFNRQNINLLPNSQIQKYLAHFIAEIKQQIKIYQGIQLTIQRNMIYVKHSQNSHFAIESFEDIYNRLQQLVCVFNQNSEQNLFIRRINTSTLQIRRNYQSEIFFSNIIFKNSEAQIQFLTLIMIDRFKNFKYLYQLKEAVDEKKNHYFNNAKFYYYEVTKNKQNRMIPNINPEEYTYFITSLIKSTNQNYFNKYNITNRIALEKFRSNK